jgi:hypothetical protein
VKRRTTLSLLCLFSLAASLVGVAKGQCTKSHNAGRLEHITIGKIARAQRHRQKKKSLGVAALSLCPSSPSTSAPTTTSRARPPLPPPDLMPVDEAAKSAFFWVTAGQAAALGESYSG